MKGWLFDIYPDDQGKMAVWVIGEDGRRIRFNDTYHPKVYISGKKDEIECLASMFYRNPDVAAWNFTYKYAQPTDYQPSRVLEVEIKDCRTTRKFTRDILRLGDYLRYQLHNCDLKGDHTYLYDRDLFPLAKIEVKTGSDNLKYRLLDRVEDTDYAVPQLRLTSLAVQIAKQGKIESFQDPIAEIKLTQNQQEITIQDKDEAQMILRMIEEVEKLDPDVILTQGGDGYLFPYLIQRATLNGVIHDMILSRDRRPFEPKTPKGKTYFSYGRSFYRAGMIRLFGRIHMDNANTFVLKEAGFDGLVEIARICRVPLHTAARNSIGSSMSSLQFYQAIKSNVLIPRNKSIPEKFKSASELLVGDRGGLVFEPKVGIHDHVTELDFSSMYPTIMVNHNLSTETISCPCCPNSKNLILDLNLPICQRRIGIVPQSLRLIVSKRLSYKTLKTTASTKQQREVAEKRSTALKWILVTCFGYMGYHNAKFGCIEGHMGVCAYGREALLTAADLAKEYGFGVVHGIVDSLWIKKQGASDGEYSKLCEEILCKTNIPITVEGSYKWIVFLPSKTHPRIGVLNRYYGVMNDGKIKLRGIDLRRRDTPKFIADAQNKMIERLSEANNAQEFLSRIPDALDVVKEYRQRLIQDEVPVWDLIVTKRLSKGLESYSQQVSQVTAAKQLIKEGVEVNAGTSIRFLFTNATDKRRNRRVKVQQLVDKETRPDLKKYLLMLYDSAANMLSFANYTSKTIYDIVHNQHQRNLLDYKINKNGKPRCAV